MNSERERTWLAGEPESVAINLFGVLNPGRPPDLWIAHLGRDAYEAGQLYLYLKELLAIRTQNSLDFPALLIYLAIVAARETGEAARVEIVEFGSTLFSAIDKLSSCEKWLGQGIDWRAVKFIGVEPLEILSLVANLLHPGWDITICSHHSQVHPAEGLRLERSFQATAYGFESCEQLVDWISRSSFGVQGIWLASDGKSVLTQMGGKRVLLAGLDELCDRLQRNGYSTTLIESVKLVVADGYFFETWLACYRADLPFLDRLNSLFQESKPKFGLQHARFSGLGGPRCSIAEIERVSNVSRRYADFRLFTPAHGAGERLSRECFDFGTAELRALVSNYFASVSAEQDRGGSRGNRGG